MQCILSIFFPLLQFLSDPPHSPTHPTSWALPPPKKNKKNPIKTKNIKTKRVHKKTGSLVCIGQYSCACNLP